MPDTRSPTKRTLSQKRSPWIAPRGILTLAKPVRNLSSDASNSFWLGVDEGANRARRLPPPCRPAAIGEPRAIGGRCDVQAPERRADGRAMRDVGRLHRRAVDPRDEARRLAVQHAEQRARAVADRRRAFDAGLREMRHQVEVERQLFGGQALVERQHVAALRRRHEIVRVLDARRDRRLQHEPADRVAREPGFEFFGGYGRVDGHRAPRRANGAPVRRTCGIGESAQNSKSSHIGTLSPESRLSRRTNIWPPLSGIRK